MNKKTASQLKKHIEKEFFKVTVEIHFTGWRDDEKVYAVTVV